MYALICSQNLLSHQFLELIFAELFIILLAHLLLRSAHLWDSIMFPQNLPILALLYESVVLNFSVLICNRFVVVLQGHLLILIYREARSIELGRFLNCILRVFCQVVCLLDRSFGVSFLTRVPVALTNLITLLIE